jgi:deoxycytidylate deaminase
MIYASLKCCDMDLKCVKDYQLRHIELAKKMALYSDMRQKHGCVIVHNGNVISYGWNHMNDCEMKCISSFHAEVDALCRLKKHYKKSFLSACELYVVRVRYKNNDAGELMNSKPCPHCEEAIVTAGVGKIYYST